MLRITQAIELKLRKNEKSISSELLKSFGLAFALHLILFFLFRIVPLPNLEKTHPLLPIAVEVDLSCELDSSQPVAKMDICPLSIPEAPPYFDNYYEMRTLQPNRQPFIMQVIEDTFPVVAPSDTMEYTLLPHFLEEEDD